jgi:hypothetical protein
MLSKGQNATLGGERVHIAVQAVGRAIDVSAVLLGDDRRVRSDEDLVFFNHPEQDGVRLEGNGVVVDLGGVSSPAWTGPGRSTASRSVPMCTAGLGSKARR